MTVAEATESREWCILENKGQKIFAVFHRPNCEKPVPCAVIMHGFASSKHGTNRSHVKLSEKLAEEGIASLRFDFRGAGDSEGCLSEVSLEDMVSDAIVVLEHVSKNEWVDAMRIGVFGSSLGGAVAMLSSVAFGNVNALALWAPVASGELWYRDFISQNPEKLKEDPKEVLSHYKGVRLNPEFQEQFGRLMAAQLLEKMDVPLLHMHGESDQTVSLLHQKVYKMHSEGKTTPSHFISYPDCAHTLGEESCTFEVMDETVRFFGEHL
ncbi:MAG: hypothetical protein S4CHLAM81_00160 [Chlamydiales bacterium]|nr:hypothetical protein [Chlamydiales bacterium]MCH9634818.1 hypothetical protein [Chlamydiales bacterium]MCH9703521.1 alpha/beta hydrolase [Chlamydiota bacterium]